MRRLFVPICFGLLIALGVPSVQAGNQEEANRIAQRLTQQYPQYNIEVAYQEGRVRLRGEVASEADRDAIANFVRHIPKVRTVSETMTVSSSMNFAASQEPVQYAEPANSIVSVQALTPTESSVPAPVAYAAQAEIAPAASYDAPLGVAADSGVAPAVPATQAQGFRSPSDYFAPQGANTPAPQNGQANLPSYAWPSYASYPNYSQVAYPKNYAADAFPYVGPFYPYPEAPMGWRKVSMQWHDGYWWLDFNDGSKNGPFSPLFRQQTKYR